MSKSLLKRPGCQDTYPSRTQSMREKPIGPFVNTLSWLPSHENIILSIFMKVRKTLTLLGMLKNRNSLELLLVSGPNINGLPQLI